MAVDSRSLRNISFKSLLYDREIIQKLWQAFRLGQSTYISYGIGLINFTLILYRLAGIDKYIDPIPFAVILVVILVPAGIIIGIIHIRKQLPTENKIVAHNNPYVYQAVSNSKETMAIANTMWQLDVNKLSNNFTMFQAEMNKKLWNGINDISKKKVFTAEDMKTMDNLIEKLKIVECGINEWKEKYEQLSMGSSVKDIPNVNKYPEIYKKN